ncbi:MAG: hypothetical protein QM758_28015 [Armatimonas sp.]
MSTWTNILSAFNSPDYRSAATQVLSETLQPFPNADAVKTLIALAALAQTESERQGVAEALAQRLDGPLVWNLVHVNRKRDDLRPVLDLAILLRTYGADSQEVARIFRRGLDEDPALYSSLLVDVAKRQPSEALREIAGYVVWRDTYTSKDGPRADLPWARLRAELESLLGTDLPPYIHKQPIIARDTQHISEILAALSPGTELAGAYKLAEQTGGQFHGILETYLVNWVREQGDCELLFEATELPRSNPIGSLARATVRKIYMEASLEDSAQILHTGLRWATWQSRPMATAFFLQLLKHHAEHKPTIELWKVASILKAQITNETRYTLSSRILRGGVGTLTKQGLQFEDALKTLHQYLPDPTLPQPSEGAIEAKLLPYPAVDFDAELESLPTPATGLADSTSDPKWKLWKKKFKR